MINRAKLLEAAAHVYEEFGFRGATTRRIAQAAGVNEVTLFRIFGSKAALIEEALKARTSAPAYPRLPDNASDPEGALVAWCEQELAYLHAGRSMIRKALGELEERPELIDCAREGASRAGRELRGYLGRLRRAGLIDPDVDLVAAAAMLHGALFADAMGRELAPEAYPPLPRAPRIYARLFARLIGLRRTAVGAKGAGQRGASATRPARSA
jgi:AcrR family transcriptional regulator